MIDLKTDFVPEVIADTIPQTLSDIGDVIETIPDTVTDGVTATVSSTRRLLRRAPWSSSATSNRRRWFALVGTLALVSVLVALWATRRSDDETESGVADAESDPIVASTTRRVA